MDKTPTRSTYDYQDTIFNDFTLFASEKGWEKKYNKNEIIFYKNDKELIFIILNDKIEVSIPLKTSESNYRTYFTGYFEAIEYGEMHINNMESN